MGRFFFFFFFEGRGGERGYHADKEQRKADRNEKGRERLGDTASQGGLIVSTFYRRRLSSLRTERTLEERTKSVPYLLAG